MDEKIVSFEIGQLAKEIGLEITSNDMCYDSLGELSDTLLYNNHIDLVYDIPAPTQSLLQKYFREKYSIHILIIPTITANWTYKTIKFISEIDDDVIIGLISVDSLPPYTEVCGEDFSTYEDALEDALLKVSKEILSK